MPTDVGIVTLICERWEEARRRGLDPSAEELCRDHPEALDEVRSALRHLRVAEGQLRTPTVLAPDPGGAGPLPELPPGCRYRLVRFLAQGGLGRVYAGEDLELGREVAVKFVRPDRVAYPGAVRRFKREAEVTGRLEHPGIAPVYGLVELPGGGFCYAMRLLDGETLADAVVRARAGTDEDRARELRRQLGRFVAVCDTVGFAHARGFLHRDLKPQNVMLGRFGEVWVLDWGLARSLDAPPRPAGKAGPDTETPPDIFGEETAPGSGIGTPGFMSPEQQAGEWDRVGPASDVFSLGATLGVILTGTPPPRGPAGDWPAGPDVPAALAAVCRRATAGDPAARYATPRDLAAEVERWLADEPVAAHRDPPRERLRRWAKRHRTLVSVAAAAVLVGLVAAGVGLAVVAGLNRDLDGANANLNTANAELRESNVQLVAAQKVAAAKQAEAERERNNALANFDVAFLAVDEYQQLTDVLRSPALLKQRKEALARSRALYTNLAERYRDHRALRIYRATALARLSAVLWEQGEERAAREQLAEAEAVARALLAENPESADHLGRIAAILGATANQHRRDRKPREAEAAYRDALRAFDAVVARDPKQVRYRIGRVGARKGYALLLVEGRRYDAALVEFAALEKEYRELLADPGFPPDLRPTLGGVYSLQGQTHRQSGRPGEALGLYRKAIDYYDGLLKENAAWVEVAYQRASVLMELGQAYCNLAPFTAEDYAAARSALDEAVRELDRLTRENPDSVLMARDLLMALSYQCTLAAINPDPAVGRDAYRAAVAIAERLAARFPEVKEVREYGVIFEAKLAAALFATGAKAEAFDRWKRAAAECRRHLDKYPDEPSLKLTWVDIHSAMGNALLADHRPKEAEAALHTAVEVGAPLFRTLPPTGSDIPLVTACGQLGELLRAGRKYADAARVYGVGIELLGKMPRDRLAPDAAALLGRLHLARGWAHTQDGKHPEATIDAAEAAKLANGPTRAVAQLLGGLVRVRRGEVEAGVADLDAVALSDDPRPELMFTAVAIYAAAADAVAMAGKVPGGTGAAKADGYAARAVRLLDRTLAAGLLREAWVVNQLKTDPDLAPLRARDDFRKLVAALESAEPGK